MHLYTKSNRIISQIYIIKKKKKKPKQILSKIQLNNKE